METALQLSILDHIIGKDDIDNQIRNVKPDLYKYFEEHNFHEGNTFITLLETNIGTEVPMEFQLVLSEERSSPLHDVVVSIAWKFVGKSKIKRKSKSNPDGVFVSRSSILSVLSKLNEELNEDLNERTEVLKLNALNTMKRNMTSEQVMIFNGVCDFMTTSNSMKIEYLSTFTNYHDYEDIIKASDYLQPFGITYKQEGDGHGHQNISFLSFDWRNKIITNHRYNTSD